MCRESLLKQILATSRRIRVPAAVLLSSRCFSGELNGLLVFVFSQFLRRAECR
jgi:hypothetical protein